MSAFSPILKRFMEKSPLPVMARTVLERVLTSQKLNDAFEAAARKQYTRKLLFSSIFELMSFVVLKIYPSINAAYQAQKLGLNIGASLAAVYDKLNGVEPELLQALVCQTSNELSQMVDNLHAMNAPWLPGYRIKILDGNCLAGTQHRLSVLRQKSAGALPGKSLVLYDPALGMATAVIACQDGHAQERSLLSEVDKHIQAQDVVIEDRNFCVRSHLFRVAHKGAYFICRHHQQVAYQARDEVKKIGTTPTGTVYEQEIDLRSEVGQVLRARAVTVRLKTATRDGDQELVILTNLPACAADAAKIAQLYQKRWTIETMFQELEAHLRSEIDTLGYPQAALFGFCVALIAYNVLAVIRAALRSIHGEEKINNDLSGYYLAGEIARVSQGMEVAIESHEWGIFQTLTLPEFIDVLMQLAKNVQLSLYKKHPRGPKKKPPPRTSSKNEPHVSTAKLLCLAENSP
jgi:DDE family transposase